MKTRRLNHQKHLEGVDAFLVDVKVDQEGKAKIVKLSQPKRYTSFNQLALLAAKKRHYNKKEVDGVFVEYWLKNVEIKHTVSPMGLPIEPILR